MNRNKLLIRNYGLAALWLSLILCCFSACTQSGDGPKVHALLIILGNDDEIRESVEKNQQTMTALLRQVSRSCEVHLTVMKSNPGFAGEVIQTVLVNSEVTSCKTPRQLDIIKPGQVKAWVRETPTRPVDILLVYYSGHGTMDNYGTHDLHFDPVAEVVLTRNWLAEELRSKPAHLKLLITDTCSENVQADSAAPLQKAVYAEVKANAQFYAKNLFLEHRGLLDITAASPGQLAYGDSIIGGHFTSALAEALIPASDTNGDDFLSWAELFVATRAGTEALYKETSATFSPAEQRKIQVAGQTPFDASLPEPTSDRVQSAASADSGGPPVESPVPPRAVTVLNFTSVPSGAKVSIDGDTVGQTPLTDYELDTDSGSTKEIEVTVKAEGYEDKVKKFRVQRGKTLPYEFELKRDIPKTITGRDGAEMVLIPAGEFQMGSNDGRDNEKPVHTVYVDAFYMDKYEVTNAQYKAFVDANPEWGNDRLPDEYVDITYLIDWNGNSYPHGEGSHPVARVSWYAAMAYAQWAGKRLPTEAEWEYAARGGLAEQKYPWGNAFDPSKANNIDKITPVGQHAPNGYGLYDMAGNVWEWCLDEYDSGFYGRSLRFQSDCRGNNNKHHTRFHKC